MKKRLIALAAERTTALNAATAAREAKNEAEFSAQMEKVYNLNAEIEKVQSLIAEQERQILTAQPSAAEVRDMAAERGVQLMNRQSVKISNVEIRRALRNAVTITGQIVQPTGAGSEIHGGDSAIASILDLVRVEDMSGLSGWEEPYVITEGTAATADPVAKSGTARAASTDPTFGIAQIIPMEITTTSYVDRNIGTLSPARYFEKVQALALRALRRDAVKMIVNGAVDGTKTSYGIKTAKNKANSNITKIDTYTAIDENTLDDLYFDYGADSELGGEAVLQLTKADLKAIGRLRGTNEKQRLFTITPQGNGNRGVIADGGVQIPYVLVPQLTAGDLIYGNPMHYLLGLFGDYEIRVDESVKSIERMHTILGDAMIGGNVVEHEGFVYYHV
jgi:HK97 family phage major capsid protein